MMRPVPRCTLAASLSRARPAWRRAGLALVLGLIGCSGDTARPYAPITDPAQLYMQLALNAGAVTLSTTPGYAIFQLTATPLNAMGEPMTGLPTPTFSYANPNDSTKVKLSSAGLLTAVAAGTNIKIVASVTTSDNVKHIDTAFINVNATTDPPPALAMLTLDPGPPDSTIVALFSNAPFPTSSWYIGSGIYPGRSSYPNVSFYRRALTAAGDSIPKLAVEYFALDPTVAAVDRRTGKLFLNNIGQARLVVRAAAYGVIKTDTTVFTITNPIARGVQVKDYGPGQSIFGDPIVIRPSGMMAWINRWGPIGVVFDDPAGVSIPPASICDQATTIGVSPSPTACDADFSTDTTTADNNRYRVRQFLVPGTYTYRDTLSGAVGTVIVTDRPPAEVLR